MSIDVHTLSGAYALDSLTPEEAAEFEAHLEGCAACREEVGEFREVVAAMGEQSWASAPRSLRDRVLEEAERTPQQRPAARLEDAPVADLAERRRRRSPALLLAAAVAVVAAAIGGFVGLRGPGAEDQPLPVAVRTVFNAPDASQVALKTANGGTLHVAVSATRQEMAVDARDLPRLDGQHVYQLWAVHDGLMISAAVLGDDSTGAAMGMPSEGTQIAVTVEPGEGSKQPTTQPIATVDPTSI
jgi:anti-sigma-K factor RskA